MADDIVARLRQMAKANGCEAGRGCSEAADEIERLRAERDSERSERWRLRAEVERMRVAGDRLSAAVNAVSCSGPRDEMVELTDAFLDWEARRER